MPPLSAGPCPRCGAGRISTGFSVTVVLVFAVFGFARGGELQWLCPACHTSGVDATAETKAFVSVHGSPVRWRERVGLPVFAAAVLFMGYEGSRGHGAADIWVVLVAVLLALTIGKRNDLHI